MRNEAGLAGQMLSIPRPRVMPRMAWEARRSIYFIGGDEGPVKIGYSCNPKARLRQMQTGSPQVLRILAIDEDGSPEVERWYHERFAAYRQKGEWFERCPEILAEIERLSVEVVG